MKTISFTGLPFWVSFLLLTCFIFFIFKKNKFRIVYTLLLFYFLTLIRITLFPITIFSHEQLAEFWNHFKDKIQPIQYIPFKNIILILQSSNWQKQILGNIILLVPLPILVGLLLELYHKYSLKFIILSGLITSFLIELGQFFINFIVQYPLRVVDIDDIILNFIGVLIASFFYNIGRKHFQSKL